MLEIVFIYIFTSYKTSFKSDDLNNFVHAWHSVSVLGHKQGFELAVPEINTLQISVVIYWNSEILQIKLYPVLSGFQYKIIYISVKNMD